MKQGILMQFSDLRCALRVISHHSKLTMPVKGDDSILSSIYQPPTEDISTCTGSVSNSTCSGDLSDSRAADALCQTDQRHVHDILDRPISGTIWTLVYENRKSIAAFFELIQNKKTVGIISKAMSKCVSRISKLLLPMVSDKSLSNSQTE